MSAKQSQTMYLPVPLTDAEQADLGRQLASAHQELRATKASNKSAMEDIKERHRDAEGALQSRLDDLARQVKDGTTWKDVEVSITRNFESRRLEVTRLDTGKRVLDKERDLLSGEYQEQLPLEEPRWWVVYYGARGSKKVTFSREHAVSEQAACELACEGTSMNLSDVWAEAVTDERPWFVVFKGSPGDRGEIVGRIQAADMEEACREMLDKLSRDPDASGEVITEAWAEPEQSALKADISEMGLVPAENADGATEEWDEESELKSIAKRLAEVAAENANNVHLSDAEMKAAQPAPSASAKTKARQKRRAEIEAEHKAKNGRASGKRRKHVD